MVFKVGNSVSYNRNAYKVINVIKGHQLNFKEGNSDPTRREVITHYKIKKITDKTEKTVPVNRLEKNDLLISNKTLRKLTNGGYHRRKTRKRYNK